MTKSFDLSFKLYNKNISSVGILVGYTLENVFKATAIIDEIGTSIKILVVNNPTILNSLRLDNRLTNWIILSGSNINAEFSGWQEGLNYILEESLEHDCIIFANDTVNIHRCFTKLRLLLFCHQIARHRNAYVGTLLDIKNKNFYFYEDPYIDNKFLIYNYISTYLFSLDKSALVKLSYQLDYGNQLQSHINEYSTSDEDFFLDTISYSLKARLIYWLFSGKGWYKGGKFTEQKRDMFRRKALCILNEFYLAHRSYQLNINLKDIFFRQHWLYKIDRLLVWLGEVRIKEVDEKFTSI